MVFIPKDKSQLCKRLEAKQSVFVLLKTLERLVCLCHSHSAKHLSDQHVYHEMTGNCIVLYKVLRLSCRSVTGAIKSSPEGSLEIMLLIPPLSIFIKNVAA